MRKVIAFIVIISCFALLIACDAKKEDQGQNTTVTQTESETEKMDEVVKTMKIPTPYCELTLPAELENVINVDVVSESPYKICIKIAEDNTELFSIAFNSEIGNLIGTLLLENENVVVYADVPVLNNLSQQFEQHSKYQDAIDTIIDHLLSDYEFVLNDIVEYEDYSVFDIQTSFTTFKYPNKWKEIIEIDEGEDYVKFSCDGVKVFDLYFSECDGDLLGTYKDIPVYIVSYLFDKENYSEEEYNQLRGMQSDVNVIIEHLMEDDNFVINN